MNHTRNNSAFSVTLPAITSTHAAHSMILLFTFRAALLGCCCFLVLTGCSSLSKTKGSNSGLLQIAESTPTVGKTVAGDSQSTRAAENTQERDAEKLLESPKKIPMGAVTERVKRERADAFNPYVLIAHKHNFILPVSYSSGINEQIYQQNDVPLREGLQQAEVKFQISLKSQLNEADLFLKDDALSLGITLQAWWQLYSFDVV